MRGACDTGGVRRLLYGRNKYRLKCAAVKVRLVPQITANQQMRDVTASPPHQTSFTTNVASLSFNYIQMKYILLFITR